MTGRVHSIQSMGTLDGPGVRFVVFFQGCPLRCGCCHNPDTWDFAGGKLYEAADLCARALRYREYFGREGGVTLSGGEPLCQAEFAREFFALSRASGMNTCLDTSGCLWNDEIAALLDVTDRVLLDIKYTADADYRQFVGCGLDAPMRFLAELNARGIPTTLRQVIIPERNDSAAGVDALRAIAEAHPCVDGIELLPFRKICTVKYDAMGLTFPFGHLPEPTAEKMSALRARLGRFCG